MPDFPTPPHRRPVGLAIRRTAAQRAKAAEITGSDAERVATTMAWHRYAPAGWQGLIDAREEPEKS